MRQNKRIYIYVQEKIIIITTERSTGDRNRGMQSNFKQRERERERVQEIRNRVKWRLREQESNDLRERPPIRRERRIAE